MVVASIEIQDLSIKSLDSTLNKLSTAYKSMTEKVSNISLVKKRRNAVKIGLESFKDDWKGEAFFYDEEIILAPLRILYMVLLHLSKNR